MIFGNRRSMTRTLSFRRRLRASVAVALFAALNAVAATPDPASIDPPVIAVKSTHKLSDVLANLVDDRIVFVGETHNRFDHHLVQLETLKFLHRRYGDVAVGVEWFQFPAQPHLNAYIAGTITEAQMLERTAYFERWRFDYRLVRPIIQYARDNGIPIVALNAPEELTQKIGTEGLESLSATERAQLPTDYSAPGETYTQRVREAFGMHPVEGRSFDNFLAVMQTWDETMAARAAAYMAEHPGRRMAVFAGSGHVMYGDGIPDRLMQRTGIRGTRLLVGPEHAGHNAADFVVLPNEIKLPPAGLLGAMLDRGEGGLRVAQLRDKSALARAGLRRNDVLLSIDEVATPDFAAVKLALLDHAPGDKLTVRYHRPALNGSGSGSEGSAVVTLEAPPASNPH